MSLEDNNKKERLKEDSIRKSYLLPTALGPYNAFGSIVRFNSAADQSPRNGSEVPYGRSSPGA
jgi:hypothetical protein